MKSGSRTHLAELKKGDDGNDSPSLQRFPDIPGSHVSIRPLALPHHVTMFQVFQSSL